MKSQSFSTHDPKCCSSHGHGCGPKRAADGLIHGHQGLLSYGSPLPTWLAGQFWGGQWPRISRKEWEVSRRRLAEGEGLEAKARGNAGAGERKPWMLMEDP